MDTLVLALRVVLSLAAVLALLWLLRRKLERRPRRRARTNSIQVVGRQALSRRASVVMVESDGKRLLLGVTEQSVNVLHSEDIGSTVLRADEFSRTLENARREGIALEGTQVRGTQATDAAQHAPASQGPQHAALEPAPVAMLRPRRDRAPQGKLGGSILSPATWKQTGAALRQGR
ncbi:flagellar biosynthetic protein FliO [Microbacterium sp. STN6]|uniref:flagellar biosynthetic protein FliO n=1 Tax=Microbacterium sp. STN6 TaxID=2995588 RepID=UPI00226094C3|nr:flagellar biosynthetic protein FliO [Microbacterium sp. STN6]MCX7522393.1 flagellar biosynthetic protein FliO [Microbacterium sp. STN6]